MQTTLRIDDEIYREAKSTAALEGISLTRFIEDALRLRLRPFGGRKPPNALPVFDSGTRLPDEFDLSEAIRVAEAISDGAVANDLTGPGSSAPSS